MKLTEAKLDQAIIEPLGEQSYPNHNGAILSFGMLINDVGVDARESVLFDAQSDRCWNNP